MIRRCAEPTSARSPLPESFFSGRNLARSCGLAPAISRSNSSDSGRKAKGRIDGGNRHALIRYSSSRANIHSSMSGPRASDPREISRIWTKSKGG